MPKDAISQLKSKIKQVQKLDSREVEPLLDHFVSQNKMFLVTNFIGQGYRDLFQLACIRQYLSEANIGTIAFQLMTQLSYLHSQGIVLKYLAPHNIIAKKGFNDGEEIELRIVDLAAIQMIDITDSNLPSKMLGLDSIFMAPEVAYNETERVMAQADTFSLGVILYCLVTGGLNEDNMDKQPSIDFEEHAWNYMSNEIKDFIYECIEPNESQRKDVTQLMEHEFIKRHMRN